jgi:hypothetical protein
VRGHPPMPMPTRCQLLLSHETSHWLAGTGDPLSLQFGRHSWTAVSPSIGMRSGLNLFGQLAIFSAFADSSEASARRHPH